LFLYIGYWRGIRRKRDNSKYNKKDLRRDHNPCNSNLIVVLNTEGVLVEMVAPDNLRHLLKLIYSQNVQIPPTFPPTLFNIKLKLK